MTPRDRFFIDFWLIPDGILTLAYLVLAQAALLHLRAHHRDAWERLGSMTLFVNNRAGTVWRFLKFFIFSAQYKTLNDARLDRYALGLRVLFCMCAVAFAIGFAIIFTQPH